MDVAKWIEAGAGVATMAAAFTTVFLAWLAKKQANVSEQQMELTEGQLELNRKQFEEARQARRAVLEPQLTVRLYRDKMFGKASFMYIFIENSGSIPAYGIELETNPYIHPDEEIGHTHHHDPPEENVEGRKFFEEGLFMLDPGEDASIPWANDAGNTFQVLDHSYSDEYPDWVDMERIEATLSYANHAGDYYERKLWLTVPKSPWEEKE